MTPEILPLVHAQGSWGKIGTQVGRTFAPLIERHVAAWLGHVTAETGGTRDAALATAAGFAEPIRAHAPFLWEEITGLARGSGLPMNQLLVLQARAEVMRAQKDALLRTAASPAVLSPPAPASAACPSRGASRSPS